MDWDGNDKCGDNNNKQCINNIPDKNINALVGK